MRLDFLSTAGTTDLTVFNEVTRRFLLQHGVGIPKERSVTARRWRKFAKTWDESPAALYRIYGPHCADEERASAERLSPYEAEYMWDKYQKEARREKQLLSPFDQAALSLIVKNEVRGQGEHLYTLDPHKTQEFIKCQPLIYNRDMLFAHYKAIAFGGFAHRMMELKIEPGYEPQFEG